MYRPQPITPADVSRALIAKLFCGLRDAWIADGIPQPAVDATLAPMKNLAVGIVDDPPAGLSGMAMDALAIFRGLGFKMELLELQIEANHARAAVALGLRAFIVAMAAQLAAAFRVRRGDSETQES